MSGPPAISVVLVSRDGLAALEATLDHLAAQTIRDQVEVVLVLPAPDGSEADGVAARGFGGVRVVASGTFESLGQARALGVRDASAPIVALGEDHAYPEPGWAAALVDAHREDWAAVGPGMVNANPESALSWGNLLMAYGHWVVPVPAGAIEHLPGSNSSYKRDLLLGFGDRLGGLLDREGDLCGALRRHGRGLCLEPRARVRHQNVSRIVSTARLRFNAGRLYAAARAARGGWPLPRRLLFTAASPLIPFLRGASVVRGLARRGHRLMPRQILGLSVGLVFDATGQMCGYLTGPGDAHRTLCDFEFRRDRHMGPPPAGAPR